jgi:hypothetical protein
MVMLLILIGLALLIVHINKTNALSKKVVELELALEQLKLAAKPAQKDHASLFPAPLPAKEPHYHQWMGLVTLASGLTYFLPLLLLKQRMAAIQLVYCYPRALHYRD